MISNIRIFQSNHMDPYYNLAVEQYLMEHVEPGCCVLYLWQNHNTVVIGRNQNAWKECRTTLLAQEGGHLARRLSGGGAVFHDLGNLNFTFLVPSADYDVQRQLSVICRACRDMGVPVEASGRNDILVEGRKFSGNAFYQSGGHAYHHGTLLVHVDMDRLGRYLSPSKAKLETKGVASVRSRVVNLRDYVPELTCPEMAQRMETAFEAVYGASVERLSQENLDSTAIEALQQRNASWEWLYGTKTPFTFTCEDRFDWGDLQLQLFTEEGVIRQAKIYSDAMDWSFVPQLEHALTGCRFSLRAMQDRLRGEIGPEDICRDFFRMLEEQEI
ncbi:MAG TPA: lipoate--protein ligase [Clostridia bacterium]|nr:lipoate--protein ligase [Clostridia bacterium]